MEQLAEDWEVESSCISLEQVCPSVGRQRCSTLDLLGNRLLAVSRSSLVHIATAASHISAPKEHPNQRRSCPRVKTSLIRERNGRGYFYPLYQPHAINGPYPFKRLVGNTEFKMVSSWGGEGGG